MLKIRGVSGQSINQVMFQAFRLLADEGKQSGSRNGGVTFLNNVEMMLEDPRRRHLSLEGRSSNIFQMIAETLWVVSGQVEIHPYLSFFLPRAPLYSDDGTTWRGAYGGRIYDKDQLQGVVDTFIEDGIYTRRATVAIHDAAKDAPSVIKRTLGKTLDTPCNLLMMFYVGEDDQFHARTIQRSGDAIFGAGSINLFEFSFIQEMVLSAINNEIEDCGSKKLEMGSYIHSTNNLHLYDTTQGQADAVLETTQPFLFYNVDANDAAHRPCHTPGSMIFPKTIADTRAMCRDFITTIANPAIAGRFSFAGNVISLVDLFKKYNVPRSDSNVLYQYMLLVLAYIHSSRKFNAESDVVIPRPADLELADAAGVSQFRKFRFIGEMDQICTSPLVNTQRPEPKASKTAGTPVAAEPTPTN